MIALLTNAKLQLGALIAAGGLTLGGLAWNGVAHPAPPVDSGHCLTDALAPAHTLLLIDTTDAFSAAQAERLLAAAEAAARALPKHGRLSIVLIRSEAAWEPEAVLSLCSPGRGAEVDPLFDTPELVEAAWRRDFMEHMSGAVNGLTALPTADESPVLQSIAALTARRDFGADAPGRRLIYIGDGLQHGAGGYSHYDGGDLEAGYAASGLDAELTADLSGVAVEVEYLRRPVSAGLQGARHQAFWDGWFTTRGATEVRFR